MPDHFETSIARLLTSGEFTEAASFFVRNAAGEGEIKVRGIFDVSFSDKNHLGKGHRVLSSRPQFTGLTSDLARVSSGDRAVIRGRDYSVSHIYTDTTGVTRIELISEPETIKEGADNFA